LETEGFQLIDGGLFTRDFLLEGIREQDAWKALDDGAVGRIREEAARLFRNLLKIRNPTEPVTEKDLIWLLLASIGWNDLIHVQPNLSAKGRGDVPDALLFADDTAHDRARREYPIAPSRNVDVKEVVVELTSATREVARANKQIMEWLKVEFGLEKANSALADAHRMKPTILLQRFGRHCPVHRSLPFLKSSA
jgi:hypothetical protein